MLTAAKAAVAGIAGWKIIAIIVAAIIIFYLFFMLIVGIIYYAAPSGAVYSGNATPTAKDDALQGYYLDIATKNDYRDRWLVTGNNGQMMNEVISTDIIIDQMKSSVTFGSADELIDIIENKDVQNAQPYWPAMRFKIAGVNLSGSNPYVQYMTLANINLDGTKIVKSGTGNLGSLDLNTPSDMTAQELDTKLAGTALQGLGSAFKATEAKYGINAVFLCSLAIHESGWGSSQIARDKNNLFGWGANDEDPYNMAKTFDSYADCIDQVGSKIKELYLTPGADYYTDPTITGVNTIYCSTPTWSDGVGSLMLELASVSVSSNAPAAQGQITTSDTRVAANKTKVSPEQYWSVSQNQQTFLTFNDDDPRPFLQDTPAYPDINNLVDWGQSSGVVPANVTHNSDYYAANKKTLEDEYHQEYEDVGIETWGLVHTATLYYCIEKQLPDTTARFKEECGDAFKPLLYYKPSTITYVTVNSDGSSDTWTENIILLTEADTIKGHYKFSYKWTTEHYDDGGSKTYEAPMGKTLVSNKEWERLDKWIVEVLNPVDDQKRIVREMLIQAAVGYDNVSQNIPWLMQTLKKDVFGSMNAISLPDQASFKNAETATGIPSWFLLGMAKYLSGMDANFINDASKATGYMQILPSERKRLLEKMMSTYPTALPTDILDYIKSVSEDKRDDTFYENVFKNPTVNVLAGSIVLLEQGLQPGTINWKDDSSWQPATADAIMKYLDIKTVPSSEWSTYGITSAEQAKDPNKVKEYVMNTQVKGIQQSAKDLQSSGLEAPLDLGYPITSHRQYNRALFGGVNDHKGIDYGAPEGTPCYAAVDGAVTIAGWTGDRAWGWAVAIVNAAGETFFCGHFCQEPTVQVGQTVRAGELIGYVGTTGLSTGDHLHFQIFIIPITMENIFENNNMEMTTDPEAYYADRGVAIN